MSSAQHNIIDIDLRLKYFRRNLRKQKKYHFFAIGTIFSFTLSFLKGYGSGFITLCPYGSSYKFQVPNGQIPKLVRPLADKFQIQNSKQKKSYLKKKDFSYRISTDWWMIETFYMIKMVLGQFIDLSGMLYNWINFISLKNF